MTKKNQIMYDIIFLASQYRSTSADQGMLQGDVGPYLCWSYTVCRMVSALSQDGKGVLLASRAPLLSEIVRLQFFVGKLVCRELSFSMVYQLFLKLIRSGVVCCIVPL